MSAFVKNVSGVKVLSLILTDNTSLQFTGGVGGQELTLELNQDATGGWTVSNGANVPGIQQPNPLAKSRTTQQLVYDASTNSWNSAPPAGTIQNSQGPPTYTTTATLTALPEGLVLVGGSGATVLTIPAVVAGPPGVGDDGKEFTLVAVSAHAHELTAASAIINGADTHVTLAGAIGNAVTLRAFNGNLYIISASGALTLS